MWSFAKHALNTESHFSGDVPILLSQFSLDLFDSHPPLQCWLKELSPNPVSFLHQEHAQSGVTASAKNKLFPFAHGRLRLNVDNEVAKLQKLLPLLLQLMIRLLLLLND